ncbi:GlxA family transcriptional regulator [Chitinophaga arvensicola]|uniref:DJ-1/PfpI family protein n=1 Tax=Chitinophaga arvensicola TaxID=29529 RepID=A0A1I0RDX4_9BACT|nr:DJ-1/PfpI family protein [Chitinophaga arvensicola]SEW38444.1 DJ-1/PfpI family protein [Chitinophaga arvensicola]
MRTIILSALFLCFTGILHAQTTPVVKVAVLLYPGVELQDFAGPADVFVKAAGVTRGQYDVYTVSLQPGMIYTESDKVAIKPAYQLTNMPKPDILVIPGASMTVIETLRTDSAMYSFIRKYKDSAAVTMSVCTGAYLLGRTGALDQIRSTTHFFVADDFQETFPHTTLIKDVRYVDEGHIITTSGVTSGIDGALHLVERYSGEKIAAMVARGMQYNTHREEAWPVAPAGMKFQRSKKKD